ncbi:hypothetical protein CPB86DRAFT_785178 [Serendipita vermifera]|nr:hypothetical protein CPB86DRAFT_785178 [Serendipita vermifera]
MSDIRKLNAEVVAVDIRKADATKLIEHPFKPQTHSNSQTPQPSQPTPSDLPVMREMMSLVIQQQQDTRKWMQQTIDAYADITSKQPKIIANALSIHKINGAIEAAIAEASDYGKTSTGALEEDIIMEDAHQPEQDDDKDADGEYEEINNEDVINGTSEEGVEEVQGATKA